MVTRRFKFDVQAACYGRAFVAAGQYPRRRMLEACHSLRIRNALITPTVGRPLTAAQLEALGEPALVARLVQARQHLLALRMAEMLGISTNMVRLHLRSAVSGNC